MGLATLPGYGCGQAATQWLRICKIKERMESSEEEWLPWLVLSLLLYHRGQVKRLRLLTGDDAISIPERALATECSGGGVGGQNGRAVFA